MCHRMAPLPSNAGTALILLPASGVSSPSNLCNGALTAVFTLGQEGSPVGQLRPLG